MNSNPPCICECTQTRELMVEMQANLEQLARRLALLEERQTQVPQAIRWHNILTAAESLTPGAAQALGEIPYALLDSIRENLDVNLAKANIQGKFRVNDSGDYLYIVRDKITK